MNAAMDADLVASNKTCKTCRINVIPSDLPFKNCSVCRGKNRIKEARRAERNRELAKYLREMASTESLPMDSDVNPALPTRTHAISSGSKSSTSSFAGPAKPKKRPPKLLHELEGKEKRQAMQEMKASLQKRVQDTGGATMFVGQLAKNLVVSLLLASIFDLWIS
jgi:hypothetical protein